MTDAKTITLTEIKNIVRGRLAEAPSLRQLAPRLGLTASGLSLLLRSDAARPGPTLLRTLGYEAVTVYRRVKP